MNIPARSLQFLTAAKQGNRLWFAAYLCALIIPWAMIFSRTLTELCCIAIGVLWLIQSLRTKKWRWLRDPVIAIGLIAWAWLLLVVTPFAVSPDDSFHLASGWIRFLLLYAALRHWVLVSRESLLLLGKNLALMLTLVAIDTYWQYVSGTSITGNIQTDPGRLSGPFNSIKVGIFTARMLVPTIGLCLFFSFLYRSRTAIVLTLGLFLSVILLILLSGERTAFLSSLIVIFLLAAWFAGTLPTYRHRIIILCLLLIACVLVLLKTQPGLQNRALELHDHIAGFATSTYGELFKAGYLIGMDNPLTGAGLRGFRHVCPELIEQGRATYCNLHPHNPYLEWFSEAGVIGLMLFIAMAVAMCRICIASLAGRRGAYKMLPAFALASIAANLFPFMPTQSTFSNWPGILLWYSISVTLASLNIGEAKKTAAEN